MRAGQSRREIPSRRGPARPGIGPGSLRWSARGVEGREGSLRIRFGHQEGLAAVVAAERLPDVLAPDFEATSTVRAIGVDAWHHGARDRKGTEANFLAHNYY